MEVGGGAHHKVVEPHWDRECQFCFSFVVILIIGFCIQVNDVWWEARSIGVSVPRYSAVVVEFDPFGRAVDSVSAWNAEVRNVSVVEGVSI